MKKIAPLLLVLFLSACTTVDDGPYDAYPDDISAQRVLDLVNDVRASGCDCGGDYYPPTTPVEWNVQLEDAAQGHSEYMNETGNLTHSGAGGSDAGDRLLAAGYDWSSFGENVAEGYITEEDVIDAWLNSEGHCRNIMDPEFMEMGVGKSGQYWTQVFASPQ